MPLCGFILYGAIVPENLSGGYFHWSLIMEKGKKKRRSALFSPLLLRLLVVHGSLLFAEALKGQWPFRGATVALSVC